MSRIPFVQTDYNPMSEWEYKRFKKIFKQFWRDHYVVDITKLERKYDKQSSKGTPRCNTRRHKN